jgi:predicted ATPase
MITQLDVQDFGCLKDVSLKLTPVHVLIGPNDSGKSTLLHALRTLVGFATSGFVRTQDRGWLPFDPFLRDTRPGMLRGTMRAGKYEVVSADGNLRERANARGGPEIEGDLRSLSKVQIQKDLAPLKAAMRGARLVRFDPDALKRPSGLLPESEAIAFTDERGVGLPGVYQAIQGRGDESFSEISKRVRRMFPTVKNLRVPAITRELLVLEVELMDGTRVRADRMSEGMLYFLAFAALPYLEPTSLLLVEEPEHGLHPARIGDVMGMIRKVADTTDTQVVIATHSPLVVNRMDPAEVTLITRPNQLVGTQVTPITDTPNFEKRASIYELGELWLSYADGELEAPLTQAPNDEAAPGG